MPISSFGSGLRKIVSFLPGTYGTSLLRNHSMRGVLNKMENDGLPSEAISGFKDALDCNIYCFNKAVPIPVMFTVICVSITLLIAAYVMLNIFKKKAKS